MFCAAIQPHVMQDFLTAATDNVLTERQFATVLETARIIVLTKGRT